MALPTGTYRAILLWAKKHGRGKFYTLEFVLETGERDRATVLFKDMAKVFPAARFVMGEGFMWSPAKQDGPQPIVDLELNYSPKFQSTRATSAARTGDTVRCDIRPAKAEPYAEF